MNALITTLKAIALTTLLAVTGAAWAGEAVQGKLYKNPNCGCCQGHANYLMEHGYDIEVIETHDLMKIKDQYDVPERLEGCHTLVIDDYVIEGHVPVNVIERLLAERPDIVGISLPGMPAGSPGMGGQKREPFTIYTLSNGMPSVYAVE